MMTQTGTPYKCMPLIKESVFSIIMSVVFLFLFCFVFNMTAFASSEGTFTQEQKAQDRLHPPESFATIPVLHDGRVKPMDSFARIHLKLFSGKERIDGLSATDWLLETLFNPPAAFSRSIFHIHDRDVIEILNLPERRGRLYSLADLSPALDQREDLINTLMAADNEQTLSRTQRNLLTVHINRIVYSHILRGLSLVVPLAIAPPDTLGLPEQDSYTALDLKRVSQKAAQEMEQILKTKGRDLTSYTAEEIALAEFMLQMSVLDAASAGNVVFRIIPPQWADGNQAGGPNKEWLSPWLLIESGQGSPQSAALLDEWKKAAFAYKAYDAVALDAAFNTIVSMTEEALDGYSSPVRLQAEILYNKLHPYQWGMLFFALGLMVALFYAINPIYLFYYMLWGFCILGLAAISTGLGLRMLVLDRPPVTTLYESVLFVSVIVLFFGMIAEFFYKNALGLFAGALSALILISISGSMAVNPDDKEVLVAVLDTNFWLATHVLIITAGYGLCLITAAIAHMHLALGVFVPRLKTLTDTGWKTLNKKMTRVIYIGALLSLLFMSVGTILGGVWADQSWGRFWGWDPKENGALLIVLWLAWVLHGRISGHLSPWMVSALHAFLGCVVALSWFGVNLLSVGLHSYGFIDGIAVGLGAFLTAEIILIGALFLLIHKTQKAQI